MDTLSAIIVTAFINILITGIVSNLIFYRYQKRIDNLYNRQMEEFRQRLAYVNYEKQTKFVTTHAKRVETLRTLYKKLVLYSEGFTFMTHQVAYLYASKPDMVSMTESDYEKFGEILEDFRKYFWENRLFLPHEMVDKIRVVSSWARSLHENILDILPFTAPHHYYNIKSSLSHYYNYHDSEHNLDDWERADYAVLLGLMDRAMGNLVREIESLYKLVAEVTTANENFIN